MSAEAYPKSTRSSHSESSSSLPRSITSARLENLPAVFEQDSARHVEDALAPPMARRFSHTLIAALSLGVRAWAADEPAKVAPAISLLKQIDQGFVQIFEKVAPSVVVIEAMKKDDDEDAADIEKFDFFFRDRESGDREGDSGKGKPRQPREILSEGSGFLIRADGFILTNVHVVADAEKIEVKLKDGRRFPAKVVGTDEATDIAVIKIEASDLVPVEFGDSDALKIGQLACAIGAPFKQDYSFTCGWVSGIGRTGLLGPSAKSILYEDYIQTDAFINPGNSGGPLFDVDGKIIGMNTLINGIGRGLAFAIPSAMLADVSKQLIAEGKVRRSWIGVRVDSLAENPEFRERWRTIGAGVVVHTIEANAPAFKSDLRPADVITQVDGIAISVAKDLQKQIVQKKVGQTVQLSVWRAGRMMQIPVTTGEVPSNFTKVSATQTSKPLVANTEALGMKFKAGNKRAVVSDIAAESPAAKAGLRIDDIVTDVESKPVASPGAVFEAIAAGAGKSAKKGVLLNIERKGKRTFVVLEPGG